MDANLSWLQSPCSLVRYISRLHLWSPLELLRRLLEGVELADAFGRTAALSRPTRCQSSITAFMRIRAAFTLPMPRLMPGTPVNRVPNPMSNLRIPSMMPGFAHQDNAGNVRYIVRRQTEQISFDALFIRHRHICALLLLVFLCNVRREGDHPLRSLFDQSLRPGRRFRQKRLPQQRVQRLVHGMEICFWLPLGRAAVAEVLLVDPVEEVIAGEHGRSL